MIFKEFLCLTTKQNTEMSDEKHSDSEFYYPEEQETAERKASRRGRHFDKVEAKQRYRYEKLVPVVLIFVIKSAI